MITEMSVHKKLFAICGGLSHKVQGAMNMSNGKYDLRSFFARSVRSVFTWYAFRVQFISVRNQTLSTKRSWLHQQICQTFSTLAPFIYMKGVFHRHYLIGISTPNTSNGNFVWKAHLLPARPEQHRNQQDSSQFLKIKSDKGQLAFKIKSLGCNCANLQRCTNLWPFNLSNTS